jgi:formiminotetrahydrofolate cyclodeaminase
MHQANKTATLVPLEVLRRSWEAAQAARRIVDKGNKNSVSDGGVAALTARTAAEGAFLNVLINLPGIDDEDFKARTLMEAETLRKQVVEHTEETVRLAEQTIGEMG